MINTSPSYIRHRWLEEAVAYFRSHFSSCWYTVPDNVRISIGFPIGSRDGKRKLGICHVPEASADKHHEIFVSPEYTDTKEVLETVAHELIHATVKEPGHRGKFKQCAIAVGFIGPFTYTPAGPKMLEVINEFVKEHGPYPAGTMLPNKRKKKKTYLLKCECATCGYIARVTAKWIEQSGTPICPNDQIEMECE